MLLNKFANYVIILNYFQLFVSELVAGAGLGQTCRHTENDVQSVTRPITDQAT